MIDNKIPTDNSGYSVKLKKSPKVSIGMKKAMAQGFYPEWQIKTTLPANTKEGKRLKKLFDDNKIYKTNFKIVYKEDKDGGFFIDENGTYRCEVLLYADTEEQKQKILNRVKEQGKKLIEVKEVEEWHHIDTDGKSRFIDINKPVEAGFAVDTTTANIEFALKK